MHDLIRHVCDSSLTDSCRQDDFLKCRLPPSTQSLRLPALPTFGYTMVEKGSRLALPLKPWLQVSVLGDQQLSPQCVRAHFTPFSLWHALRAREQIKHLYIEEIMGVY